MVSKALEVLLPATSACGVVGNLLSVAVLLTAEYRNKVYGRLLCFLAVADTSLIVAFISQWLIEMYQVTRARKEVFAHHFLYPLYGFSHVCSIYGTVIICIERYVVISR